MKAKPLWQKLYEFIIDKKEPIPVEEMMKKFKLDRSVVYNNIYTIRNKKSLEKTIITKNGHYFSINRTEAEKDKTPLHNQYKSTKKKDSYQSNKATNKDNTINNIIPAKYIPVINQLNEIDRKDFFDMVKKSFFYKASAIALLDAHLISYSEDQ